MIRNKTQNDWSTLFATIFFVFFCVFKYDKLRKNL